MQKRIAILVVAVLSLSVLSLSTLAQQSKAQRPSPAAHAECKLPDGKLVTVDYSSPRMRGRKIFGGLEAYGRVWRLGANEATTFVTPVDLVVGGKDVPAGSYTMFVYLDPDKWQLIISKKTGEWGIPYPGEAFDLMRTDMMMSKLSEPLENFTISFTERGGACGMHFAWETTRATVELGPKK